MKSTSRVNSHPVAIVLGVAAVGAFLWHNHLFSELSSRGCKEPHEEVCAVPINNHGKITYISDQQDAELSKLMFAAVALGVSAGVIDSMHRKRVSRSKSGDGE